MTGAQALLLVDLQTAFLSGAEAVPAAAALVASVDSLLDRARRAGCLVIHLQNDGEVGAPDEPGEPGWELYVRPLPGEPVVRKSRDDGFDGTGLGSILTGAGVSRLVIAGLLSEMCVAATARTALDRGYAVVLPRGAHATYDIPPGPGFADIVPARVVSRVAEWSLGDQIALVTSADDVSFD
jgi:streptothricin hydrolase